MKVFCSKCKQQTNHVAICQHMESYTPDTYPEMQIDFAQGTWQIIKCQGYDEVSFREVWVTSEDLLPNGDLKEIISIYPRRDKYSLQAKDFFELSPMLRQLYKDTIEAFNSNLLLFCAVGLRALIERICEEHNIAGGNLKVKIEGLHSSGHLSEQHAHTLHELRFMGNSAVHELETPTKE